MFNTAFFVFFNSQIYTKLYLSKTGISSREKYHFLILYNVLAAPKIKIINQMIYCKNYERMVLKEIVVSKKKTDETTQFKKLSKSKHIFAQKSISWHDKPPPPTSQA